MAQLDQIPKMCFGAQKDDDVFPRVKMSFSQQPNGNLHSQIKYYHLNWRTAVLGKDIF